MICHLSIADMKKTFCKNEACLNCGTFRDVSTGAIGATAVAPKFSDTLTLFQPRGADSAHHWHGRTYIFLVVTSLNWCLILGPFSTRSITVTSSFQIPSPSGQVLCSHFVSENTLRFSCKEARGAWLGFERRALLSKVDFT